VTTPATQRQCPQCERHVDVQTIICPFCGYVFIDNPVATTRALDKEDPDNLRSSRWGNSRLGQKMKLLLQLVHDGAEYAFDPMQVDLISLGRRDPATQEIPSIDLGRHKGEDLGISRKHLYIKRIENNALTVLDQGSVNGTYLNGQRLIPHQPRILRDGDEIRLGRMVIRVAFVLVDADSA